MDWDGSCYEFPKSALSLGYIKCLTVFKFIQIDLSSRFDSNVQWEHPISLKFNEINTIKRFISPPS